MTINELSDSALSEWVANKLEPNPEHGRVYTTWREYIRDYKQCVWQPRDMVGDAAMTVLLMERPLSDDPLDTIAVSYHSVGRLHGDGYHSNDSVTRSIGKPLGRAVAEAFCLSMGWKP